MDGRIHRVRQMWTSAAHKSKEERGCAAREPGGIQDCLDNGDDLVRFFVRFDDNGGVAQLVRAAES